MSFDNTPRTFDGAATDLPGRDLVGQILHGRYEVLDVIASGGMGTVYRALHLGLDREVALKVMTPTSASDAADLGPRFRREARALAALDHPNIVAVFDSGELPDSQCFLAMELVQGTTLELLLRAAPPPMLSRLEWLIQVCDALGFMHARGLVHRDVKLANIMIERLPEGRSRAKVVDLGLARSAGVSEFTQAGLLVGSPRFMAPEQIECRPVDPRTDVYAVGVVLYFALSGRYPFDSPSMSRTLLDHVKGEVPPLNAPALGPAAQAEAEDIIKRCMAKDPNDRYADASELAVALRGRCERVAPAPLLTWRRGLALTAACLCAGIVLGLGMSVASRVTKEGPPVVVVAPAVPAPPVTSALTAQLPEPADPATPVAPPEEEVAVVARPLARPVSPPRRAAPPVRPSPEVPAPEPVAAASPTPTAPLEIAPVAVPTRWHPPIARGARELPGPAGADALQ